MFHPVLDEFSDIDNLERSLGISPQTPILVSPAGGVDETLVRFFNSPQFGKLAYGSRKAYAKDIRLWVSYLASRAAPLHWTEAAEDDVLAYALWRRRKDLNPDAVGGAKWDRELAALTKLYAWASRPSVGLVASTPVEREVVRLPDGSEVDSRKARSVDAVHSRVTWVTPRTYRRWRDVGLLGYRPDGTRDAHWGGRNAARNRAYTDLLFGSGLRSQEASTLLTLELPTALAGDRLHEASLSQETAKRRARRFYMLDDSLRLVIAYMGSTRRAAVARARAAGRYEGEQWLRVTKVKSVQQGLVLTVDGKRLPVGQIGIEQRRRLLRVTDAGPEPMWLWLKEDGLPFQTDSWDGVFDAANERVLQCLGDADGRGAIYLTQHSLRHSYALYMLVALHQAIDRKRGFRSDDEYDEERYRQAWDMVRDFLGHATTDFTKRTYLEPLDGVRMLSLFDDGADDLDAVLGRLAALDPRVRDLAADA